MEILAVAQRKKDCGGTRMIIAAGTAKVQHARCAILLGCYIKYVSATHPCEVGAQ